MVVSVHKSEVRCTLVGDGMVGKTCLAKSFAEQTFPDQYVATVMDKYKGTTFVDGAQYTLKLNDLAGEHEDDNMRSKAYKDTDAFIVCYSVVDRDSFESVKSYWTPEIRNIAKRKPVIIVATQTDLRKQGRFDHVTKMEGSILAKETGASAFVECSAFNKDGVSHVFKSVVTSSLKYNKCKHNLVRKVFAR